MMRTRDMVIEPLWCAAAGGAGRPCAAALLDGARDHGCHRRRAACLQRIPAGVHLLLPSPSIICDTC